MKLQRLMLKAGLLLPLATVAYLGLSTPEPTKVPAPAAVSSTSCDKPQALSCKRVHLESTRPGKIVNVNDDNWCREVVSYMKDHPVLVWFPSTDDWYLYKQDWQQLELLAESYSDWKDADHLNVKVVRINPKCVGKNSPIREYFHGSLQDIYLIQSCRLVLDHRLQITRPPLNTDPWQVVGPHGLDQNIYEWIMSVKEGRCLCHEPYRNRKPDAPPPSVIRTPDRCGH